MDLFYCMAVEVNTAGEAQLNWIAPTGSFNLTDPGTTNPTFTALEGFTGDGTDYLATGYVPATSATNMSQNSITVAGYCRTSGFNAAYQILGVATAAVNKDITLLPRSAGNVASILNSNAGLTGATSTSYGFVMSTRRGATETEIYKNGISLNTDIDTSTGLAATYDIWVLARNNQGVLSQGMVGQVSIALLMNAVSSTEAADIYNIIQGYMVGIGKSV
jgi:hypothetical protein